MQLHVVHGHADDGNDACNPDQRLPPHTPTTVTIDIRSNHVSVYFDFGNANGIVPTRQNIGQIPRGNMVCDRIPQPSPAA